MITKYLEVGNNEWGILISYDFDYLDYDDIASLLEAFGVSDKSVRKSLTILSEPNTGMAVSNSDIRMTAIFIGYATTASEFWNTVNHELRHAASAISDYYRVTNNEEAVAYLHGELMRLTVEEIGKPCK